MRTPFIEIDESLGIPIWTEMPAEHIYWVSLDHTKPPQEGQICDECYLIPKNYTGNVISKRALSFGAERSGLLVFDGESGTRHIIDYELTLYKLRIADMQEQKLLNGKLLEYSIFGRDLYPDYFGAFVPPADTPMGPTLRHIQVCNGVFFVEGGGEWLLAVCYPIWCSELKCSIQAVGLQTDFDRAMGIDSTFGFLFFDGKTCAPVIYDLLQNERYQDLKPFLRSYELLVAALWKHTPWFLTEWNREARHMDELQGKAPALDQGPDAARIENRSARIPLPTVSAEAFLNLPE